VNKTELRGMCALQRCRILLDYSVAPVVLQLPECVFGRALGGKLYVARAASWPASAAPQGQWKAL